MADAANKFLSTLTPEQKQTVSFAFDNVTDTLALDHGSGFYRPGFSVTGGVELNFDTGARTTQ